MCGETFDNCFIARLLLSLRVKEFSKPVNIWLWAIVGFLFFFTHRVVLGQLAIVGFLFLARRSIAQKSKSR